MTTATDRKRAERERYRRAGLIPVQVWVKPADRQKVQQYAERLNRRAARQESADAG